MGIGGMASQFTILHKSEQFKRLHQKHLKINRHVLIYIIFTIFMLSMSIEQCSWRTSQLTLHLVNDEELDF